MKKNKIFITLYSLASGIKISLIGTLMLAEIIALINIPFINIKFLLAKYKGLQVILGCLTILLLAQMFSDLINNSASTDYLRGWSVMVFAMISTIYLINHLTDNPSGIIYYLFGIFLIRLLFGEGEIDSSIVLKNTNYFKTRFVVFINPAIMMAGYYLFKINRQRAISLLFLFYGLISMVLDARSNGLIFIISSILIYIKTNNIQFSKLKIFSLSIIFISILYLGYIFYVNQVLNNKIGGSNARTQLSMSTNPYNPFELIYYGRTDFFVLAKAVIDKPIFGHGSWGRDTDRRYAILNAKISKTTATRKLAYIPAHSVFMGSWAYAGIVGFLATLYMFTALFKYFARIFTSNSLTETFPVLVVIFVEMVWSYFFSPLGLLRTTFPIFAALIIIEYSNIINNTEIISDEQSI